ncbi:MAG: SusC/RagA family TonB-linked outer membrane protein [Bacteroidota bacterium]
MHKTLYLLWMGLFILLLHPQLYSQSGKVIISGQVTDSETGETLIGCNIVEVDANGRYTSGTISDGNGNYLLKVSSSSATVMFVYIGYEKQRIQLSGQKTVNVKLKSQSTRFEEVVVVGEKMGHDGVVAVRDRATAVSRIELDELKTQLTPTVEELLQGRITNMDITATSGDPGAGLNIRIRGTATLNARNDPLIVVNGIPYNTNIDENFDFSSADIEQFGSLIDVSPEDIESIEVLKDAASTAIWGSRAANGVLMIKTKRGFKSPPRFDYSSKVTFSREPSSIPMLDGEDYTRLIKESHFNVNGGNYYDPSLEFDPNYKYYHEYNQNTDWVAAITQPGHSQQHNFSVTGGGDKSKYSLSMGYQDQKGTTVGTGLKKTNFRASVDYSLSRKLKFRSDIMFTNYNRDALHDGSIRSKAYRKMPNMSIYERDSAGNALEDFFIPRSTIQGTAQQLYNPVAYLEHSKRKEIKHNYRALFGLNWRITEHLVYDASVSLDIADARYHSFLPYEAVGYNYYDNVTNSAWEELNNKSSIYSQQRLVYKPDLGYNHSLSLHAQADIEQQRARGYRMGSSKSASWQLTDVTGDINLRYLGSGISEFRSAGAFLNAHYIYKDRYIASAGVRYEGNSRFSRESRWGFFPTLTAAWRLSGESFMENVEFIDEAKLRISWGLGGNSPGYNYLFYNRYSASSSYAYLEVPGIKPSGIELTSLKWETIEQLNPGLSLSAFKHRLNIEVDLYQKLTHDLYISSSGIPNHSGYSTLSRNEGEMLNKGWEFMTDIILLKNRNWNSSINFNISHNENVVIALPENYSLEYGNMIENGNYKISIEPGRPLGGFFGYDYTGVYSTEEDVIARDINGNPLYGLTGHPMYMMHGTGYMFEAGDAIYNDINHDGIINEQDLVYLGDLNPKLMGGAGARVSYKGLTFNIFLHYKLGQKVINQTRMNTEKMYNHDNQSRATNWRWRRPGDVTEMPRALYSQGYNWMGSDRFVEDGSFIRVKTTSLSYRFQDHLLNRIRLNDLRIYVTAYNLFTFTNYSGQDPDVGIPSRPNNLPKDNSRTPPGRRIMVGLNLSF